MIWRPDSASTYKENVSQLNFFFDEFFENRDFWALGIMKNYPWGPGGNFEIAPGALGV